MTSLLAHKVAQPTKCRFLPKTLTLLNVFWLDSLDHESIRIRLNFKQQTISKNEVIKNGFIISCSPNPIILTETKIKNIKMIFDIENWLSKSNFGDFLTQLTQVNTN